LLIEIEPEAVERHVGLTVAFLDILRLMEAQSIIKSLVDSGVSHPQLRELREAFSM